MIRPGEIQQKEGKKQGPFVLRVQGKSPGKDEFIQRTVAGIAIRPNKGWR